MNPCTRAILLVGALLTLSAVASAQGYGYQKEQDPLVLGVKKALLLAKDGKWEELDSTLKTLDWQVTELKSDVGVDMTPRLRSAVKSQKNARVGYVLTELVFQALRQKFHWNLEEKLAKYVPARARLDAASFYYEEILSHTVRRADRARKTQRHAKILALFRDLRPTLGAPGLFGMGGRKPDLQGFRRISDEIEALLREVYPDFMGPKTIPKKVNPPEAPPKRDG